jgi:hypothetical protein
LSNFVKGTGCRVPGECRESAGRVREESGKSAGRVPGKPLGVDIVPGKPATAKNETAKI